MKDDAPTTYWHIIRHGVLAVGMFVRKAAAEAHAAARYADGDYEIVAASGRAELRARGYVV
jgi:hypothetical protein